jgi:ECF sigma factor
MSCRGACPSNLVACPQISRRKFCRAAHIGAGILVSMSDLSTILAALNRGDRVAAEKLLPLVYDELRVLAAQRMAQERPGQPQRRQRHRKRRNKRCVLSPRGNRDLPADRSSAHASIRRATGGLPRAPHQRHHTRALVRTTFPSGSIPATQPSTGPTRRRALGYGARPDPHSIEAIEPAHRFRAPQPPAARQILPGEAHRRRPSNSPRQRDFASFFRFRRKKS